MKATEKAKLHQMNSSQLQSQILKLQKDLVIAQLNQQLKKDKDTNKSKKIRKDIARIKTILHHKQLTKQTPPTKTAPKPPSPATAKQPKPPAKKTRVAKKTAVSKKSARNTNQK